MHWLTDVLKKWKDFGGRSGRKEFWMFVIISLVVVPFIFGFLYQIFEAIGLLGKIGTIVSILYSFFILCPLLAVMTRRLHDTGRSGWWAFLYIISGLLILAAFTLGFVALFSANSNLFTIALICTFLGGLMLIIFLVFMCLDSQPGTNQYGPNPKGITAPASNTEASVAQGSPVDAPVAQEAPSTSIASNENEVVINDIATGESSSTPEEKA